MDSAVAAGLGVAFAKTIGLLQYILGPRIMRAMADAEAYKIRQFADANAYARSIETQSTLNERQLLAQNVEAPASRGLLLPEGARPQPIVVLRIDEYTGRPRLALAPLDQGAPEDLNARRLRNFIDVANFTFDQLPPDAEVSEEQVSPATAGRFAESVKDECHEEMQRLWAKLLADEILNPGFYSPRTMAVLRDLSPDDARLFSRVCAFVIYEREIIEESNIFTNASGISYEQLLHLENCGLLRCDGAFYFRSIEGKPFSVDVQYHHRTLKLTSPSTPLVWHLRVHRLTEAGRQIMRLRTHLPNEEYLNAFAALAKSRNIEVREASA